MFKNNSLISVNFHLIKNCNEKCMYCYARFDDKPIKTPLDIDQVNEIITLLRNNGTEKITFAGGEPTLFQHLGDALMHAKKIGMVTSIVTNGARLENLLKNYGSYIDWVALSIDSTYENIQQNLGRGDGSYIRKCVKLAGICHRMKIKLKMNTVVTNLNYKEDFSELIKIIQPRRWTCTFFNYCQLFRSKFDGDVTNYFRFKFILAYPSIFLYHKLQFFHILQFLTYF